MIPYTRYVVCECECEMFGLIPICEGTSKALANSMALAFTPIGTGTNSFAAFTFATMEAPKYADMLFHVLSHLHAVCKES